MQLAALENRLFRLSRVDISCLEVYNDIVTKGP